MRQTGRFLTRPVAGRDRQPNTQLYEFTGCARSTPRNARKERGSALLAALIISLILLAVALSLTSSSINQVTISDEFERHQAALTLAEAGLNVVRTELRGKDLADAADQVTRVPDFVGIGAPLPSSYAARNPIPLEEARTVDFANPPAPQGFREVTGLLTPPLGEPMGPGRYFAKITQVERTLTQASLELRPKIPRLNRTPWLVAFQCAAGVSSLNPLLTTPALVSALPAPLASALASDESVTITYWVIRVVGVYPLGGSVGRNVNTRNTVAVLEAFVGRDESLQIGGAVALLGPDNTSHFSGNSFDVEGSPERPGISFLYDNPSGGDAGASLFSTYTALSGNQYDNIRGAEGPFGPQPSLRDDTEQVRSDPHSRRILDPSFLSRFAEALGRAADVKYTDDATHLSGSPVKLGTKESPKLVVVEGDFRLSGSGSGCGLLVVRGGLEYDGAFDYEGLVMVVGEGSVRLAGANKTLTGGLLIARLEQDGSTVRYGRPQLDLRGNSNLVYSEEAVRRALSLLPLNTWSWREITPELEPET